MAASFMTLALSMAGFVFYGARSAWERIEPWITAASLRSAPEPASLYGIDITGSRFLTRPAVQRAVEFAALAHRGQFRKNKEPYVAHCVATAAIVEGLLAPTEEDTRAEAAIITALLHDVLDDAGVDLDSIQREFGPQIASMVSKVSQLSATNQLVRRRLRLNDAEPTPQEAAQLRHMIVTMVSEPLVIVVKLADRLHNMRTVYALAPNKQKAVAEETRRVWCSLSERLGMFALKSELEDLCFAVLQPDEYRALRAELDEMWGLTSIHPAAMAPVDSWDYSSSSEDESSSQSSNNHNSNGARIINATTATTATTTMKVDRRSGGEPGWLGAAHATVPHHTPPADQQSSDSEQMLHQIDYKLDPEAQYLTTEQSEVRELVRSVLPFDASTFNMERLNIPPSARRGLEVLQGCARALLQEITMEGVASGLEVSVQGRVKSLFSTFKKMARKSVPLTKVYDARALRVVVEDFSGARELEAISACYKLLPAVHRMWKKVDGEDDDYIAQPKESGYQSLHTAVMGPGGVPMEVQIRTATMHDVAEYGRAAHWAYKEHTPALGGSAPAREAIATGHPVLHISRGGQLRDAVVVESESEGMRLVVAVSLTSRRFQSAHTTKAAPMEYTTILNYVAEKGYFSPGQGDLVVNLELFTLCSDGKYHRLDKFGQKLPTVAVPLAADVLLDNENENKNNSSSGDTSEMSSGEEDAFAGAGAGAGPSHQRYLSDSDEHSAVHAGHAETTGRPNDSIPSSKSAIQNNNNKNNANVVEETAFLNNRIRLLRSMLEWGADIGSEIPASTEDGKQPQGFWNPPSSASVSDGEQSVDGGDAASAPVVPPPGHEMAFETSPLDVMVLVWPSGSILRVPRGTTAGTVARREGGGGSGGQRRRSGVVNVNNRMVSESTCLQDGDYVVLTQETVKL
jgi:HD domain/Region found in RelA / SpoT proteins